MTFHKCKTIPHSTRFPRKKALKVSKKQLLKNALSQTCDKMSRRGKF